MTTKGSIEEFEPSRQPESDEYSLSVLSKFSKGDEGHDDDGASVAPTLVNTTSIPRTGKFTSTGDIIFSFGPGSYHFLYLADSTGGYVTAATGADTPSMDAIKNQKFSHVYMHSFSPAGDEFCLYKNKQNALSWSFHQAKNATITYRSLRDWLMENLNLQDADSILKCRVVFGEGASFFASNGKTYIQNDLPRRLKNEFEKRYKTDNTLPDILSLGAKETYFARWAPSTTDNDSKIPTSPLAIWHLSTESHLHSIVTHPNFNSVDYAYIFLSPMNTTHYVAVLNSGQIVYQIPDAKGTLAKSFMGYMQQKAKQSGRTFTMNLISRPRLKTEEVTYISAETDYELPIVGERGDKKGKKKRFILFSRKDRGWLKSLESSQNLLYLRNLNSRHDI